mmetsp:Transcript_94443/g.185223  ORF Transcript_94443/g.185223 Transcript_94443/m.185223 type:complete len:223 (+) Transcript_94443:61-729(+)
MCFAPMHRHNQDKAGATGHGASPFIRLAAMVIFVATAFTVQGCSVGGDAGNGVTQVASTSSEPDAQTLRPRRLRDAPGTFVRTASWRMSTRDLMGSPSRRGKQLMRDTSDVQEYLGEDDSDDNSEHITTTTRIARWRRQAQEYWAKLGPLREDLQKSADLVGKRTVFGIAEKVNRERQLGTVTHSDDDHSTIEDGDFEGTADDWGSGDWGADDWGTNGHVSA